MIHSKRVIFMILPLLFVPLVYGMSSTPDACAAPEAGWRNSQDCTITSLGGVLCCWEENGVDYCQTCIRIPYGTPGTEEGGWECTTPEVGLVTPPPLFGRNIPLPGGVFEQPEITAATPIPRPPFGQIAPEGATLAEEGENIQPMNTTFPTPQPFPPPTPGFKAPQTSNDISPDLAPEDDQDETDDGQNDIPDTGITEQPETQQPEDSSEGAETAGPLT
jgi:hypothetical protein